MKKGVILSVTQLETPSFSSQLEISNVLDRTTPGIQQKNEQFNLSYKSCINKKGKKNPTWSILFGNPLMDLFMGIKR